MRVHACHSGQWPWAPVNSTSKHACGPEFAEHTEPPQDLPGHGRRMSMSSPADSPLESTSTAEQFKQQVEGFAESASEYYSDWSEQLRACTESAEQYVRKEPIKSL